MTEQGADAVLRERKELAARVRAAIAYAHLKLDDIVERTSFTHANINRTVGARRNTPEHELVEISNACQVPLDWFLHGRWNTNVPVKIPDLGKGTIAQRMAVVEQRVLALEEKQHDQPR
jgi:hypothetical protein